MHTIFEYKTMNELLRTVNIDQFWLGEIKDFSIESMYLNKEKERTECTNYLSAIISTTGIGYLLGGMPFEGNLYLQIKPSDTQEKYWLEICKEPQIPPDALDTYNTRGTPFFTDKTQDSML